MNDSPPRWKYRFENFKRAFLLLSDAVERLDANKLDLLAKEGLIQRFEYTWELSWKVLKDYLDISGIALDTYTPASIIRASYEAQLIDNGDVWMQALTARSETPRGKPRGISLVQAALAPCLPVPVFGCTSESLTH